MKKAKIALLSILVVVVMSFSACGFHISFGDDDEKETTAETKAEVIAETTVGSEEVTTEADELGNVTEDNSGDAIEGEKEGETLFPSMKELAETDEIADLEKQINESLASTGTLKITGEGSKLYYTYTMNLEYSEEIKDQLTEKLIESGEMFKSSANAMKGTTQVETPVVVIRYLDKNGKEIVTQEFVADSEA